MRYYAPWTTFVSLMPPFRNSSKINQSINCFCHRSHVKYINAQVSSIIDQSPGSWVAKSKPLLPPRRNRPQILIHLSGPSTQNKTDDRLPRHADILESAEDMDLLAGEDDPRSRGVLNGELGLAVCACDAPDCASQVVALEGFDVFDFERFDVPANTLTLTLRHSGRRDGVQIIQPQQRNRIVNIKPQRQRTQKILSLLQRPRIRRKPRIAQLDRLVLDVHAHLQL